MNITLDKLNSELEKLAIAMPFVGSYFFGDYHDALTGDYLTYPIFIVTPQPSSLNINNTNITLAFILADRYSRDKAVDNMVHVQSDMVRIISDIRALMRTPRWREHIRISENIPIDPFINRSQDLSAGWVARVTFEIDDFENFCQVPLIDYDYNASMDAPGATCDPVTYEILNTLDEILYSGSVISGGSLVKTIQDSTVSNSDDSYSVDVAAEGNLLLPDINVTDSDGSIAQVPSVKDVVCTPQRPPDEYDVTINGNTYETISDDLEIPVVNTVADPVGTIIVGGVLVANSPITVNSISEGSLISEETLDIQLTDGTNPVNPTDVTQVGNTMTIEVPPSATIPCGQTLMKTGQTTSYRTGDDGDLESGRLTSFSVLPSNNPFGNTSRFTDELGGSTYTNDWVIDWSTFDGSTVLGYYRVASSTVNWDNAIDQCLANTFGTFTGCRLTNVTEFINIMNREQAFTVSGLNYAPFNIASAEFWLSNTLGGSSTNKFHSFNFNLGINFGGGTNLKKYIPVRTFTVTGTTLS